MVHRPVPYPDEPPNIDKDTLYPWVSPLIDRLTTPQNLVPAGDFLLPICTTSERMLALLKVIRAGAEALDLQFIGNHSIDLLEALAHLDDPTNTPCLSVDGDLCRVYKPSGSVFNWEMWNPFSSDPFPTGYNRSPFVVYTPDNLPAWSPQWLLDDLLGLQPGDVFTSIDVFAATGLQDFLNSLTNPIDELPYFVINANGGNTLRIKLFGVPQGGFVRIYTRNTIGSGIVFDLDSASVLDSELSDLLNLVLDGELFPEHIVDYEVPGVGAQEVVIVFLPDYSGGLSVGFGGGIRSVEVCGEVVAVEPEFRIENCILEWRPDAVSNWIQLGNVCGQDGAPGQNGLPAPIPVVQVTAIPGGTHVAFDMDADLEFEDSFDVLNGQDGTPAPTPLVTISEPTPGNHLIEFDMNANGISDDAVLISDGINGTNGVTPQPIISNLAEGVFIGWDLNNNGTSDTTQVKISGDCDCDTVGLPQGFTDTQKCNAAVYMAGQLSQIAKDAAYASIVNGDTGSAWWALFKSFFDFNPSYDPALTMLDYIEGQVADYNAFAAEIDLAESRLAELLYCDPSDLLRTSAITNWNVEPVSASVSADAKEVIYQAILATPLNQWAIYLQDGLLQTGADCTGLCIEEETALTWEIDFTTAASMVELGAYFSNNANGDWGEFIQGEGIKPRNVGQYNIYVYWQGLFNKEQTAFEWFFNMAPGSSGYARPANGETSGSFANMSNQQNAINPYNLATGATYGGYGAFFNALTSNAALRLEKLRITFTTAVSLPSPWVAIP